MICRLGALMVVLTCTPITSALSPCVCTREMNPVCGSDGKTYNNKCMLDCKRQDDPNLTIEKPGHCRSLRETDSDICACPFIYKPVCGSDGKTYPNECALECEKSNIKIVYNGECRQKREDNPETPCICTDDYTPVCGSNGQTFPNICALECEDGKVELAHPGECKEKSRSENERQDCFCTFEYNPVCGSNGVTYGNLCELKCQGGDVELVHNGECRVKREVDDKTSVCVCGLDFTPVCGSDGVTYGNKCSLDCLGGNAVVVHKGECKKEVRSLPPCLCTKEARPVCGTDGKTYSNPCLLNCAREKNEDLHVDHPGPCKK